MTRRIVTQCESIDADFFMISVIRNAVRSSAFWLRLRAAGVASTFVLRRKNRNLGKSLTTPAIALEKKTL
jgi:hypothetical protein